MRIATLDTSRAPEFLHTVQLVNFAFPVTRFSLAAAALIVSKPSHVGYRFDFAITVPHRETDEPMELHWAMFYPPETSHAELVRQMYATVYNMLVHELCEAWIVNGWREEDPHGSLGPLSAYNAPTASQ
jgi:hypothetical protein